MSGFKFGRERRVGKHTLVLGDGFLGNAPTQKTEKTEKTEKRKNGKNGIKERKKRKIRKIREKGPNPPNLLVFPVFGCLRSIAKGLGGDEKKNSAETMRKLCGGAALERGTLPTSKRSAHEMWASQPFHPQTQLSHRGGLPESSFATVLECFAAGPSQSESGMV